jgi:transcriptional regulator with XRE-family HTH domain
MAPSRKKKKTKAGRPRYPDLATYLEESGDTQVRMSNALRLSQGYLSRVAAGLLMPSLERANLIAQYANVPVESFVHVCRLRKGAA